MEKTSVGKSGTAVVLPKRKFTVEFFVGIFVIIGCLCLAYLAINIAKMSFLKTGFYEITASFLNVSGLEEGAPVEIAGVPVGEVTKVNLNGTDALVTMKILNDVKIREDDRALIRTKGIIGERYVKIDPGPSQKLVPQGGQIADTDSAVDFEEMIGNIIHRME